MHPYNQRQIEQRLKRKRAFKALLDKKWTIREIAKKHGISRQMVERVLK